MSRHEFALAYDATDKSLYRIPPKLTADDPEFARVRQWCHDGLYVCGADDCEDNRLDVRATYTRPHGEMVIPVAAHFRHRFAAHHGEASPRASAGESVRHLTAKRFLRSVGEQFGHRAEVEVHTAAGGVVRRPDVVWTPPTGGRPWAVEAQFSPIPTWQWRERTTELQTLGYQPLWFWGVESRSTHGLELVDDRFGWSEKFQRPSDVWVVEVGPTGLADADTVHLARCHSPGFDWERRAAGAHRRPPWPNVLEYDRSLPVERCDNGGVRCPDIDAQLAALKPASLRSALPTRPNPGGPEGDDHRDGTAPTIIARLADSSHLGAVVGSTGTRTLPDRDDPRPRPQGLSKRDERCGVCGDPLFCCPATIRRSLRCCPDCTHRTQHDIEYERTLP